MQAPRKRAVVAALTILVGVATAVPALAVERLVRTFDQDDGLPVSFVKVLAQDVEGFLWIGTSAGLARFDGGVLQPWGRDRLDTEVQSLAVSSGGRIACSSFDGGVFEVSGDGVVAHAPEGFGPTRSVAFDSGDRLVIAGRDGLRRESIAGWETLPTPPGDDERGVVRLLGGEGPLIAATDSAAWSLEGAAWTLLGELAASPVTMIRGGEGSILVLQWDSTVTSFQPDGRWEVAPGRAGRGIGLALRGDTLWVASDRHLVAHRSGDEPEVLDNAQGIWSGGPLFVDREGSLWMGTFAGLLQFPEPETRSFSDLDGLPSAHARFVEEVGGRIWVSAWQGLGWIGDGVGTLPDLHVNGAICGDADGRLWGTAALQEGGVAIVEVNDGEPTVHAPIPEGEPAWAAGCWRSTAGTVWLSNADGLWESPRGSGPPIRRADRPHPFGDRVADQHVLVRSDGRLVLTAGNAVCEVRESTVREPDPDWLCSTLEGQPTVRAIAEATDGSLWAVAVPGGVFRDDGAGWRRLPASDHLETRYMLGLQPSKRGGMWLLGHSVFLRVTDDGPPGPRFEVVERLGPWEGLLGRAPRDLLEAEDGATWVTTNFGVTRIPGSVLAEHPPVPEARLVEAKIDGAPVSVDAPSELGHGSSVELRFSALSFRDPARVRYRVRTEASGPWAAPRRDPVLFFLSPNAGRHRVEVASTLDGVRWSEPAGFSFRVRPPWFLDPRIVAPLAFALLLAVALALRLRVQSLLRVERLRSQVAMDLHDEVGSGLGSIGMLAEVAGAVPPDAREEMLGRITDTAAQLGRSLSAIVWSLRSGSADLAQLTQVLRERANRLFPTDRPALTFDAPEPLPTVPLDLAVQRTVLLVGLEAMHNAAKHSGGDRVEVTLRQEGARWALAVADDGRGIEGLSDNPGGGFGLGGMHRRAREVGAILTIESAPGEGTTVTLRFSPKAGRPTGSGA